MIKDEPSPIVIGIARDFISLVTTVEQKWSKAYFRFSEQDSVSEAKASLVSESGARIIDVLQHRDFFDSAVLKGQELLHSLGKEKGLFLLVIDSSFDYEIKFEYKSMNRWKISKLDGGTGVPQGLE